MLIKQLSVFLENKKGRLCAAVDVLAQNGIDISALSLADTAEFGVLRLIVDDPRAAQKALAASGVTVCLTDVVAVAMEDVPGGSVGILRLLSEAGINVEYLYACVGKVSGQALMVLRVDDEEAAESLLRQNGLDKVRPGDIYRL